MNEYQKTFDLALKIFVQKVELKPNGLPQKVFIVFISLIDGEQYNCSIHIEHNFFSIF